MLWPLMLLKDHMVALAISMVLNIRTTMLLHDYMLAQAYSVQTT